MTDKKKVLIISYYWPPSGGPGVQRWLKFVKYLREFNIEPVVVTVDDKKASYPVLDDSLQRQIPEGIRVEKTNSFEPLRILSFLTGKKKVPYAGIPDRNTMSLFGKLSLYIRANYFIPDARKGWNKYAFKKCCTLIEREQIDFVVTTSPPHSTQLIGLKLKKKYPVKWLADLRDPWTDIYYYSKLHHSQKAKNKDQQLERDVLSSADIITVTSEGTRELFAAKIQNQTSRFRVITNGYDEADIAAESVRTRNDVFTIVFSGTINKQFGIDTFLHVIAELKQQGAAIRLSFIGNTEPGLQDEILELLPDTLFRAYLPHREALVLCTHADMLLLAIPLGQNQGTVPGKTFEYLATQNPVLCLSPPKGAAADIIESCEAGRGIAHNDREALNAFVLAYYGKWVKHESIQINNTKFRQYSRRELTKKLADIIFETI